jgi:predicted mannosyl-3-phosphoglycerate phosphatase (HAD superfamily)
VQEIRVITSTVPVAAASHAPSLPQQPPSASVVVIADVERLLRHSASLAEVRPGIEALLRGDTDIVLCSDGTADRMLALQRELGLRQPFICARGAALHIPRGFFSGPRPDDDGQWEVIDFGTARLGHAVRLIVTLYRAAGLRPLFVGIGEEWRDRALLREVDSAVVVRNSAVDQMSLVRSVPSAYVTEAEGSAGWMEAIVGSANFDEHA